MGILSRYLAIAWMKWFFLTVSFLVVLLLIQSVSENLFSEINPNEQLGLSWYLHQILDCLSWTLPVSCLVATLLTLYFLKSKGELSGLFACSVSIFSCFGIIVTFGIIASSLGLLSIIQSKSHKTDLEEKLEGDAAMSTFRMKTESNKLWFFHKFDFERIYGENIQLYAYDTGGNNSFRIRAQSATWNDGQFWVLENGQFLGFKSSDGFPVYDSSTKEIIWKGLVETELDKRGIISPLININFDTLNLKEHEDDPTLHILLANDPERLSFSDLAKITGKKVDLSKASLAPYKYRFYELCWNSISCLVAIFCGLMIGVARIQDKAGFIVGASLTGLICFYFLRTLMDSLGENGVIEPFLASGMPYIAITILSILVNQLINRGYLMSFSR